jgi:hypothetical protein
MKRQAMTRDEALAQLAPKSKARTGKSKSDDGGKSANTQAALGGAASSDTGGDSANTKGGKGALYAAAAAATGDDVEPVTRGEWRIARMSGW